MQQIAAGATDWLKQGEASGAAVAVGYDTRFLSPEAARTMARCLAEQGIACWVTAQACPSPYLAFATKHSSAPLGIQITASHNPCYYNGVKLKGPFGGSLVSSEVARIEAAANTAQPALASGWASQAPGPPAGLAEAYMAAVLEAAAWGQGINAGLVVDYMHGSACGTYRDVLAQVLPQREELRAFADPLFGGTKPEPLAPNLGQLIEAVKAAQGGALGIAFDGDGDRLGVIDERGRCLATHEIFCLLLEDVAQSAPEGAVVVTTVSFSSLVERVAHTHNLLVYEVPVGFRHVSEAMLQFEAVLGGEESGGAGFGHFLPERDALLMALRLLRFRARQGASLAELVDALYAKYGRPCYLREDFTLAPHASAQVVKERVRSLAGLKELAGEEVISLNHRDGMKVKTAQGWVLVRPSGTEPLLRTYAEASSDAQARAYLNAALEKIGLGELRA